MSPRNTVQQPVVQLGTAIYGKRLSGGAPNGAQKLLQAEISSPSNGAKNLDLPMGF
ncbi:MAG: hypothetical protein WBE76_11235 [Terracidiphilus sp.]